MHHKAGMSLGWSRKRKVATAVEAKRDMQSYREGSKQEKNGMRLENVQRLFRAFRTFRFSVCFFIIVSLLLIG